MAGTSGPGGPRPAGALRAYLAGVRLLGRGLALYVRTPRLLGLGLIPVLLTAILFTVALIILLFFLEDLATVATWFADDWPETGRTLIRVLAGVAILGVALLLGIVTFTAVALAVGDPIYERISGQVEQWCGGITGEVESSWWRSLRQSLADSARVIAVTAPVGIVLFLLGFLPAVGQTAIPVLGATVGGWFLAVELVGIPFSRRGLRVRDRWRALRRHRAMALGFGTAVFVCFLVPGGAILVMPAAVAGGALLARHALGLPAEPLRDRAGPKRPIARPGPSR